MWKDSILRGVRDFTRRRKSSLIFCVFVFIVTAAFVFCELMLSVCEVYTERNENPYSDYYRLLIDQYSALAEGASTLLLPTYTNKDQMSSGYWPNLVRIHEYYLNITDYTAELSLEVQANITPVTLPEMREDDRFTLYGVTECMELSSFARGDLSLPEGRYLTRDDRENERHICIISEDIALLNELSLGDEITFTVGKFRTGDVIEYSKEEVSYEIVGIYRDNIWRSRTTVFSGELQENHIYVPMSTLKDTRADCYNYQIKLDNDKRIDEIEAGVNYYNLAGGYAATFVKVSDLFESDNQNVHTMERVLTATQYLFVGITVLFVLIFIYSMNNSRMKEYGVYLALGARKADIFLSTLTEVLLSVLIGLAGAAGAALLFARKPVLSILDSIIGSSAAEAIKNTTSDMLAAQQFETAAINTAVDQRFITDGTLGAVLTVFLLILAGTVVCQAFILSAKPIRLLAKREEV